MAKVLGIVGSPRRSGNTAYAVNEALKATAGEGLETKIIELAGKRISPCNGCWRCPPCRINDDMQAVYKELRAADGIILASPVYFGCVTAQLKAFMDRTLPLRREKFALRDKVCGAIAVGASRNGGQERVVQEIHSWALIHDMIVVSDGPPNPHFGGILVAREKGDVVKDEFGLEIARGLGKRIAQAIKRVK